MRLILIFICINFRTKLTRMKSPSILFSFFKRKRIAFKLFHAFTFISLSMSFQPEHSSKGIFTYSTLNFCFKSVLSEHMYLKWFFRAVSGIAQFTIVPFFRAMSLNVIVYGTLAFEAFWTKITDIELRVKFGPMNFSYMCLKIWAKYLNENSRHKYEYLHLKLLNQRISQNNAGIKNF